MIGYRHVSRTLLVLCIAALAVGVSCGQREDEPLARRGYDVAYATYLGGSMWDQAREVIPYPDGSVLVAAQTSSADIPTTEGVVQPKYAGDDPNLGHGGIYGGDCYLAKLSPDGSTVLAATYFGGSRQERNVYGVELDGDGNIVITSTTRSRDIPTTEGCFQPEYAGGEADCFAAKLSPDLTQLLWCTYVGGAGDESPRGGLALDPDGNVCLFATTSSGDYPTTAGVHRTERNGPRDAAITMLKSDGSGLLWSTLLGGSAQDYMVGGRVDESGNVYFAGHTTSPDLPVTPGAAQPTLGGGHDAYLVKLSGNGTRLDYVTYIGGSQNEFPEHRPYLAPDGSVLLPGVSASADFPTTAGAFQTRLKGKNDAFLTKLSADGKRFVFSTLLGGSGTEFCLLPTPDEAGRIFIVGQTESKDLPVTAAALQESYGGGNSDGWLAVVSPDGSELLYCTYLGGSGDDMVRGIALGPAGEVYLVGHTMSDDFPVTEGAAQTEHRGKGDAYVVKLVPRG
jgi:hypothetical protein